MFTRSPAQLRECENCLFVAAARQVETRRYSGRFVEEPQRGRRSYSRRAACTSRCDFVELRPAVQAGIVDVRFPTKLAQSHLWVDAQWPYQGSLYCAHQDVMLRPRLFRDPRIDYFIKVEYGRSLICEVMRARCDENEYRRSSVSLRAVVRRRKGTYSSFE